MATSVNTERSVLGKHCLHVATDFAQRNESGRSAQNGMLTLTIGYGCENGACTVTPIKSARPSLSSDIGPADARVQGYFMRWSGTGGLMAREDEHPCLIRLIQGAKP